MSHFLSEAKTDLFSNVSFGGGGGGGGGNNARRGQMARNATARWNARGRPTIAKQIDMNRNGTPWDEVGTGLAVAGGAAAGGVSGGLAALGAVASYLSQ